MTLNNEYFKIIKSAGFSGINCLFDGQITLKANSPFTIKEDFFDRVDWAIQAALNNNLIVVNIHHFEEIFSDPTSYKEKLYGMCEKLLIAIKITLMMLFLKC